MSSRPALNGISEAAPAAALGDATGACFNVAMRLPRPAMMSRQALRLRAIFAALLLAALAAACDSAGDPAAQQWLHGAWELTFNPERDSRDDLVFSRDGSVQIHTENKQVIPGKYRVVGDELQMVLVVNDKPVEVEFGISPDKSRLTYSNGAYYMKKSSP